MQLEIHVEKTSDEIPVIHLKGEIDLQTCSGFKDTLREMIDERYRNIVIDLAEVPYLDSAALGVLVDAVRRVREDDGGIYLVATTPFVRRAFEITRLARIFELSDSLDSALGDIRSKTAPSNAAAAVA
jgi:anti-anti-sigma factor